MPSDRILRLGRPLARRIIRSRFTVVSHDEHHVPRTGPALIASNHIGLMDGPLMGIFGPRPVHALTKREMFEGGTGRVLRAAGQIPLDRMLVDPLAIKTCLRVLAGGGLVGVYPEGTRGSGELNHLHAGLAYLALASGAPVVPLVMFGSRPPDGGVNSVPARGDRVDMVYGAPLSFPRQGWPRTREQVRATSALLHRALLDHLAAARTLTGRELPGPIPDLSPDDVVMNAPASTKEMLDD